MSENCSNKQDEILYLLNKIQKSIQELQTSTGDVLTFEQAKDFLNVSGSYLYKLTSSNQIPCYKPRGKQLYFDKEELKDWLLQNRNTTVNEIESQAIDYVTQNPRG